MDIGRIALLLDVEGQRLGGPISTNERKLLNEAKKQPAFSTDEFAAIHEAERQGRPIIQEFLATEAKRREDMGHVPTPASIVTPMLDWIEARAPKRLVDMGCGVGAFAIEAAKRFNDSTILAADIDPTMTLALRCRMAIHDVTNITIVNDDYLHMMLEPVKGPTAFIGNPPYVRHHALEPSVKAHGAALAKTLGVQASGLSGLHLYFLLATAKLAQPGDVGCVITSNEWFVTNYGASLRHIFVENLGLQVVHTLDAELQAFPGVLTTAAILGFKVGAKSDAVAFEHHTNLKSFGILNGHHFTIPSRVLKVYRWPTNGDYLEDSGKPKLGELFRVHRGMATGANDFFVMPATEATAKGLDQWVRPVLCKAKDLPRGVVALNRSPTGAVILCAHPETNLADTKNAALRKHVLEGEKKQLHERFLCAHRKQWWSLGSPQPPPIIVTYMGRGAPRFALNRGQLLILNTFHGLYPTGRLSARDLKQAVARLNEAAASMVGQGRTYQGGLEKFEPRELEMVNLPTGLEGLVGFAEAS